MNPFPPLPLDDWQESRDTLHRYCQVIGRIRRALTPRQKHWWHISLRTNATGLTTTPIPAGDQSFEINLDLTHHLASINTSKGDQWDLVMEGQPVRIFMRDTLDALFDLGIEPKIDRGEFSEDTGPFDYDDLRIEDYWQALAHIDLLLKEFKGTLREETSPVQLWPHHFDLSLVWFSGRLVPGVDPADEKHADEQMAFGFSTGDAGIPDPYFYITAYPWPAGLEQENLPAGAEWHNQGWQGALLMYQALVDSEDPRGLLMDYWTTVHTAGKKHRQ